jgi:DNA-binding phage protein
MMTTQFDRDFDEWMQDPAFAAAYERERERIDAVDEVVRALDAARVAQKLTKAEVARQAGLPAQSVRRFFTKGGNNPTLGVTVAIARVLDVPLVSPRARLASRRIATKSTKRSKRAIVRT